MNACLLLLSVILMVGDSPLASAETPEGWFLAGNDPKSYAVDVDRRVGHEGNSSGRLASTKKSSGFGTMMQSFDAREYADKRLRFSGWVKSNRVTSWAGLWMRVDGFNSKVLSFDNMGDRPIKGTKDWTQYAVVLDVPKDAESISCGILMDGEGTVWIDEIALEVVDQSVPTTGRHGPNRKPKNLNFEK